MLKKQPFSKKEKEILVLCHSRTWISLIDLVPLHFKSAVYARRVMRRLEKKGAVKIIRCLIFAGKGQGHNFYSLTKKGYCSIFPNSRFKEPKTITGTNLLHHYVSNTFLTGALVLRQKFPELYADCISEKELTYKNEFYEYMYDNNNIQKLIRPDFVIGLGAGSENILYFGEVDTCTETVSGSFSEAKTIENKFRVLVELNKEILLEYFNKRFSKIFNNLVYLHITTGNEERIEKIASICQKIVFSKIEVLITNANQILPCIKKNEKSELKISFENLLRPVWQRISDTSNTLTSII